MSNISPEDHNEWLLATQGVKHMTPPTVIETPKPRIEKPKRDTIFTHDLHGMVVDDAFKYVKELIVEASEYDVGELRIITGKSGRIFREFPQWMNLPLLREYVRGHSLEQNGGSYLVFLHSR